MKCTVTHLQEHCVLACLNGSMRLITDYSFEVC